MEHEGAQPVPASGTALDRLAAPEVATDGAPTSLVTGRLVDRAGSPRAGVLVQLATWKVNDDDFDFVRAGPLPAGGQLPREKCTTTTDGRFEFRLPATRRGNLDLGSDGLVFAEDMPDIAGREGDRDLGDVTVLQAGKISGVVRDRAGLPIVDVAVEAHLGPMGMRSQSSSITDAAGRFEVGMLKPGSWTVQTKTSRFKPTMQRVELAAEEQRSGLVIELDVGGVIAGRVIDDRGMPVAGCKVGARRIRSVAGMEIESFSGDEAATTAADGTFVLAGLEGETATLRAFGDGHTTTTLPGVAVGTTGLDVRVERAGRIEGVLVGPDGAPIAGSEVVASRVSGSPRLEVVEDAGLMPFGGGRSSAKTDAQGRFVIDDVHPGLLAVRATGDLHKPVEKSGVQVAPGANVTGLRLVADPGATVRVTVVDETGAPVVGAKVGVKRASSSGEGMRSFGVSRRVDADADGPGGTVVFDGSEMLGQGTTDELGIADVRGLSAADGEVHVTHESFAPNEPTSVIVPASGVVESRVTLSRPGFVAVRVLRADGSVAANTNVLLEPKQGAAGQPGGMRMVIPGGGDQKRATTDADGRAKFGPLRGGDYRVLLSRGPRSHSFGGMVMVLGGEEDALQSSAQDVAVFAGKTAEVDLTFPQLTHVTGVVTGADGPIANCIVELGSGDAMPGMPGMGGPSTKTDANGVFSFDDVEGGDYVLSYGKDSQLVRSSEPLTVPSGAPEVQKDLVVRTGTVRVRVMSRADATPVEKAEVTLERGGPGGGEPRRTMMIAVATLDSSGGEESTMTFGRQSVKTDADGYATIEDVPVGDYTLKVEQKRFSPASKTEVTVVEQQRTDCGTIELDVAGVVRGTVKDEDGSTVAMALVERRLVGESEWSEREVAQGGRFRLAGLTPGRYELRARRIGGQNGPAGDVVEVEVKGGETATADLIAPK
ncbi:MAG: carboxypeptidase regulatory-like domain-containing protein [Planctomycetes bacterium]|nr:carboxypeptidase regulatory-like domain-containing protein [Planctomycetota bacterium]